MWVFTTLGFFSIVAHREQADRVLVRARDKIDLLAFKKRLVSKPSPRIVETPDADYRYRITARKEHVAELIWELTEEIDYDNFKNAVARRQGRARADLYHDVWHTMLHLQPTPGRYNR